jgi:hypothetical protein
MDKKTIKKYSAAPALSVENDKDFFYKDLLQFSSSEHPHENDTSTLDYRYDTGENLWMTVSCSTAGWPTLFDRELLMFCMKRVTLYNQKMQLPAQPFFNHIGIIADSETQIDMLMDAFNRLRGVCVKAFDESISRKVKIFGLINEAKIVKTDSEEAFIEIYLSDQLFAAIRKSFVVEHDYKTIHLPLKRPAWIKR